MEEGQEKRPQPGTSPKPGISLELQASAQPALVQAASVFSRGKVRLRWQPAQGVRARRGVPRQPGFPWRPDGGVAEPVARLPRLPRLPSPNNRKKNKRKLFK